MWIIIAQIICLAVAVVLIAISFDLDHETPALVRYPLVIVAVAFFAVFLITFRNRDIYEHAAAIAFTGLGVLILAVVLYLVLTKRIQPVVMKVAGTALSVSFLLWVVGSCSDIKRQQLQIQGEKEPTSTTVVIADSTKEAIQTFNSLSHAK